MALSNFYVTTPIYYVNDIPHLGHAYTTVAADALRRYHALRGAETRMLTGTDEHGLKIERQATERGITPKAFVDEMSQPFRDAWPHFQIHVDDFIRTTEPRHMAFVQDLWKKVAANGFLRKGSYEGWYCVGCEGYKTEKDLLPGNVCPEHLKPVEWLKEETYFFELQKFEKQLLDLYEKNPGLVGPATRRNEVISFVSSGLKELSVSRTTFNWGIPVPGDESHVMYVWFDALANYLSALGGDKGELGRFWPPKGRAIHLVGKDILRFHAVYWPAFLLAAGYSEAELPTQIFAHGFLTIDGQKMSKSLRNAVDPIRLAKELGSDTLRYYLLRAIAFGQDGDFDHAGIIERYNADLANNLGNLLHRTFGLCAKFADAKPALGAEKELEIDLRKKAETTFFEVQSAWEDVAPHRALELTWALAAAANQYVDRAAPWAVAKAQDWAHLERVLATLLEVLRHLSVMIWPAMPAKSDAMRAQLGLEPIAVKPGSDVWPRLFTPTRRMGLAPGAPLFPTFDKDAEAALLARLVPKTEVIAKVVAVGEKASPVSLDAPLPKISYDQFVATELKVGIVRTCEKVPKKDKLLRLAVDLGEAEPRTIIAGLALSFTAESLVGRRVVVVANLEPRDFGKGLVSHGMLLATGPSDALILATVEGDAAPGMRLK